MKSRLTRWLRSRGWRRLPKLPHAWRRPLLYLAALILIPVCLVNVTVAWVGQSAVFPLSPFYLRYKVQALWAYAWHRPRCVFVDDVSLETSLLARVERRHHLPCGLLGAIVQVESGGKAHRISSAGAMGPLQLIPPTARALGVSDPFDPEESLDGAARLSARAARRVPRRPPGRGRLQRRTRRRRRPRRSAERSDRDLRRSRDADLRGRAPGALPASPKRSLRGGVRLLPGSLRGEGHLGEEPLRRQQ